MEMIYAQANLLRRYERDRVTQGVGDETRRATTRLRETHPCPTRMRRRRRKEADSKLTQADSKLTQ